MSNNRYYAFDFSRAIAIILIVSCHFLLFNGLDGFSPVGKSLANIGNFCFFSLSALLFGLRFESQNKQAFKPFPFMIKRIFRLFASLWPFLMLISAIYYILGEQLSVGKLSLNFIGLCWFGKLPNNGHLWFVTMIIICYIMYIIVANTKITRIFRGRGFIILIICALFEFAIDSYGLPGYLFMVLGYSFCFFTYAAKYLNFVKKANDVGIWIWLLLSSAISIAFCFCTESEHLLFVRHMAGYFAGFAWLTILLKYGGKVKSSMIIEFLSKAGYEIYLLHHCLCCGALSVIHSTSYPILNYMILWTITLIIAIPLHKLANRINSTLISNAVLNDYVK